MTVNNWEPAEAQAWTIMFTHLSLRHPILLEQPPSQHTQLRFKAVSLPREIPWLSKMACGDQFHSMWLILVLSELYWPLCLHHCIHAEKFWATGWRWQQGEEARGRRGWGRNISLMELILLSNLSVVAKAHTKTVFDASKNNTDKQWQTICFL